MSVRNILDASLPHTHVGLVLSKYSIEDRIMSDDWGTVTYALVWDPAVGDTKTVRLYDSEFEGILDATVDATPEVIAAWESLKAAKEAAKRIREEVEVQEHAMERVLSIHQGARVVAVRGHKVPVNSVGTVTRIEQRQYGMQICFMDETTGVRTWSALSNFMRIDRSLPENKTWLEYEADLDAAERITVFNKGDVVRVKSVGVTGLIFWVRDGRYGVTPGQVRDSRGFYTDVVWANSMSDLEHVQPAP